jgi:FkbM family methyltransferase
LRRPHDRDFEAFSLFPTTDRPFLDVGANAGMSALSFRLYQRDAPIVSVEPNPFHADDLRFAGRLVGRFQYHLCAAGDSPGTLTLCIPVYRGVPLTTEAALDEADVRDSPSLRARLGERMDSPDFTIERREVEVRPLDSLALRPAFVKLDVQGHDLPALRGLRETLTESRPVVMIESATTESHELLVELGYVAKVYDAKGRRLGPARWPIDNVFYIPD